MADISGEDTTTDGGTRDAPVAWCWLDYYVTIFCRAIMKWLLEALLSSSFVYSRVSSNVLGDEHLLL